MAPDNVTLYHGTPMSRALEINRMGKVSPAADSMMDTFDELKTSPGFVYLTTNPGLAAYYGNMLAVLHKEMMFCIYKIRISRMVLETDYDELVMRHGFPQGTVLNLDDSLGLTQSCRTPVELVCGKEVLHCLTLPSNNSPKRDPVVSKLLTLRRVNGLDQALAVVSKLPWQAID